MKVKKRKYVDRVHSLHFEGYTRFNSQGHNLYKLQYISLEEVKIVSFQQWFQSEAIESNLSRLYLKLFTPRSNFSPSEI